MPTDRLLELVRFGLTGALAVALHYGVYIALLRPLGATWAYVAGYGVSFIFNYFGSSLFTFRSRPTCGRALRFLACHVFNFLFQLLLFRFGQWQGMAEKLIPAFVLAVAVPVNYLLVRKALKEKKK